MFTKSKNIWDISQLKQEITSIIQKYEMKSIFIREF